MSVTVARIRLILNMKETQYLEDDVIQEHIDSAGVIINSMNKNNADAELVEQAKLRLAAFFAYQAYSDHPVDVVPGEEDEETADWTPIAGEKTREMRAKLDSLKQVSDMAISAMLDAPAVSPLRISAIRFHQG